jgi:hypothetical protein
MYLKRHKGMTETTPDTKSRRSPFLIWHYGWIAALLMLICAPANLFAGVDVYPLYLFLTLPNRTVSVSVTNPTETRQEAWVDFRYGYPVAGDSGKFAMHYVDSPYVNEPAAVSWMRAFPQRFVLGPKESQLVRIMISPPPGLTPGEYWARVVVSSFDRELKNKSATAPGGNLQMHLQYISQIDIPLHYRVGHVTTGLTINNVTASPSSGKLILGIGLNRIGTASYWGTMTLRLRDHDGKIMKSEEHQVAVYKDILYPYSLDISTVPAGTYTLEVTFATRRPGVQNEYLIKTDPVKYNQEITLP